MTSEKPSSVIRSSDSGGVRPPSAQLKTSGATPRSSAATRSMSASEVGASTNRTSAPASAKARARAMASSVPVTATASVRAMISRSGSRRASTAARSLPHHLVGADQPLAAHVPALLGRHLVLELDPGDAGLLVELHGADDVDRVAVAGVGVGDHRHVDGGHDPPGVVDHLAAAEQPDVGAADQRGRRPEAGHVDGVEAGLLDQPGREGVVRARRHERRPAGQQLAQPRPAGRDRCSADPPRTAPSCMQFTRNLRPNGCDRERRRPYVCTQSSEGV